MEPREGTMCYFLNGTYRDWFRTEEWGTGYEDNLVEREREGKGKRENEKINRGTQNCQLLPKQATPSQPHFGTQRILGLRDFSIWTPTMAARRWDANIALDSFASNLLPNQISRGKRIAYPRSNNDCSTSTSSISSSNSPVLDCQSQQLLELRKLSF
jgi:hypothetical protein